MPWPSTPPRSTSPAASIAAARASTSSIAVPAGCATSATCLTGTGMGTQAYSVIEQGKVDVLLQSSPRDRRVIFEEAAGISRFKLRKLEALRRLERVDQNLLRLSDIVDEVDSRLRTVRAQAGKARRYKEYTDRLQELRTQVGLVDWRRLTARLDGVREGSRQSDRRARRRWRPPPRRARPGCWTPTAASARSTRRFARRKAQIAANRERIAGQESTIEHERSHGRELEDEIARYRRQLLDLGTRADDLQQQLHDTTRAVRDSRGAAARDRPAGDRRRAGLDRGDGAAGPVCAASTSSGGRRSSNRCVRPPAWPAKPACWRARPPRPRRSRQRSRDRIAELDRQLVALAADLDRLRRRRDELARAGRRAGGPAGRRQAGPRPIAAGIGRPARRTGGLRAAPQRGGGTGRRARGTANAATRASARA